MTLTDIKEKIAGQLSKLTIDDFYSDPQISFANQTFSEMTKLKTISILFKNTYIQS
jgi:hypothetical protein